MRWKAKGTLNHFGSERYFCGNVTRQMNPTKPSPCVIRYWFLLDFPFGWLTHSLCCVYWARWAKREINPIFECFCVKRKSRFPLTLWSSLKRKVTAVCGRYRSSSGGQFSKSSLADFKFKHLETITGTVLSMSAHLGFHQQQVTNKKDKPADLTSHVKLLFTLPLLDSEDIVRPIYSRWVGPLTGSRFTFRTGSTLTG